MQPKFNKQSTVNDELFPIEKVTSYKKSKQKRIICLGHIKIQKLYYTWDPNGLAGKAAKRNFMKAMFVLY